ncbi:hypothetical protein G647_03289 [Cladophialophora carrionii CBS 160.54]|uniref:Uncharacterized protein n=1 Tax=Cladophialophora carrionii CBS 160.54 TaxID=1279043 RepID=V9DKP0_9EURO|nr:uncharacterized protein G647_03289 [Cladophialophora carrionii CBS 160.54]ETI26512.1 hypothetical protein G647_03289 [Cladophialophora carrionii CBS 160.54]
MRTPALKWPAAHRRRHLLQHHGGDACGECTARLRLHGKRPEYLGRYAREVGACRFPQRARLHRAHVFSLESRGRAGNVAVQTGPAAKLRHLQHPSLRRARPVVESPRESPGSECESEGNL